METIKNEILELKMTSAQNCHLFECAMKVLALIKKSENQILDFYLLLKNQFPNHNYQIRSIQPPKQQNAAQMELFHLYNLSILLNRIFPSSLFQQLYDPIKNEVDQQFLTFENREFPILINNKKEPILTLVTNKDGSLKLKTQSEEEEDSQQLPPGFSKTNNKTEIEVLPNDMIQFLLNEKDLGAIFQEGHLNPELKLNNTLRKAKAWLDMEFVFEGLDKPHFLDYNKLNRIGDVGRVQLLWHLFTYPYKKPNQNNQQNIQFFLD